MSTVLLAWRNLVRNRRRSLMTLIAMVLGLVAVMLFGGYIRDINYALQSDFVRLTGHLQIQHKDYFGFGSGNPTAYGVQRYERVIDVVRDDPVLAPLVAVVTPVLQFGAIAGNFSAGVSRTAYVTGVVVEDQNRLREWNDYGLRILASRLPLSGSAPDTAVIGTGLARVLQLCEALHVPDCVSVAAKAEPQGAELAADIAALSGLEKAPSTPEFGQPQIELLAANARGAPNVAAVKVLRAEFQGIKELRAGRHGDLVVGEVPKRLVGRVERDQVVAALLEHDHRPARGGEHLGGGRPARSRADDDGIGVPVSHGP